MEKVLCGLWFELGLMVISPVVMDGLRIVKDGKNIEPRDTSGATTDPRIFGHLSARTIYWNSFQGNTEYLKTDLTDVPAQCEPVHFSLLLRHGATNPRQYLKDEMLEFYEESGLSADWKEDSLVSDWSFDFEDDTLGSLADVGYEEAKQIGQRYRTRLPQFFSSTSSSTDVVSTPKIKAVETAMAFIRGLNIDKVNLVTDDTHTELFTKVPEAEDKTEYYKWRNGSEYEEVSLKISRQLFGEGSSDDRVNPYVLDRLMKTCGFEEIVFGQSKWCSLFDLKSTRVMEYTIDMHMTALDFHYNNSWRGCQPMRELVSQIVYSTDEQVDRSNKNKTANWKSWILTGHASTLFPIYRFLNLFVDEPPLGAKNFLEMSSRKFRTSKMMPMAANLAIVAFRCNEEEKSVGEDEMTKLINAISSIDTTDTEDSDHEQQQEEEEKKVPTEGKLYFQVYVNEILTKFDFCDDTTCELTKLQEYVEEQCDARKDYT